MEAQRKIGKYPASRQANFRCLHVTTCRVTGACLSVPVGERGFTVSMYFPALMRAFMPAGTSNSGEYHRRVSACLAIICAGASCRNLTAMLCCTKPTSRNVVAEDNFQPSSQLFLISCPSCVTAADGNWPAQPALETHFPVLTLASGDGSAAESSWVGSGSVPRKVLQNRRLLSALFVYGGFGKTGAASQL